MEAQLILNQNTMFESQVEVSGHAMLALLNCISKDEIMYILWHNGLDKHTIKLEGWYPIKRWLNAFKEIQQFYGTRGSRFLVDIGIKYAETAYIPEGITTLEDALIAINDTYQMNHRNGYAGELAIVIMGAGHLQVVDHTPYPADFTLGVLHGIARRYSPTGVLLTIQHDDLSPCRKRGDDSCTYDITWAANYH
jgi:hypothetical protein